MGKRLSKYRDYSVLNTDAFDKRRFNSILNMSDKLKELNKKVSEELYTFQPLMGDLWASLYKMSPQLKEEVSEELQINKNLMSKIMNDESFEIYRSFTKLDDLASAMATVSVGEKTYEWLIEMKEENERIKELMKNIQRMNQEQKLQQNDQNKQNQQQSQTEQNQQNNNDGNNLGQQQENGGNGKGQQQEQSLLQQAFNELLQEFENTLNESGFGKSIQEAMKDAKDTSNQIYDLLGSGKGKAELKKVPLREQIKLGELLSSNKKLREVANWAGRMKSIALKKQKSKHDKAIDRNGVTIGSEVENIFPSEWGMYSHPTTRLDFLRRFVEGQTLQYEQKGKAELGKGPIIVCLDQSGSMKDLDSQAKGFALALLLIAKKQKRDFCYIPFSSNVGKVRKFERGKILSDDIVKLATEFMSGGTNFQSPLSKSLEVIKESRFKKSDVIFITDGRDRLSDEFIKSFNEVKQEKEFHILSLVLSDREKDLKCCEIFSDKVVGIKDFQDENGHIAFEI